MNNRLFFTSALPETLQQLLAPYGKERIFVLLDEHTQSHCWPLLSHLPCLQGAETICIPSGEAHKSLPSLQQVWQRLVDGGARRTSLLLNVGGGMVCDLGGMAAATFKRGMDCINLPTTLLAMVDASIGGKTAVNFAGLKNEIGVFALPKAVVVATDFLRTLPREELLSGYAEMLKHSLLADPRQWSETLRFDMEKPDWKVLAGMIQKSVEVKRRVVEQDPKERGKRKALNLGHTVGHALESLMMEKGTPVPHGWAVAAGLVCELYLSVVEKQFPIEQMRQTVRFILERYGRLPIDCNDYPTLLQLMEHDKKNTGNGINFTLLADIGQPLVNQTVPKELIADSLDFYREG